MLLHLQTFVSFFFFFFCDNHCMQQPCPEKKANFCDPISIWNLNYCDSACVRANPISTTNRSVQVESHKIVSGEEIAPICTRMTLDSTRIQFVGLSYKIGCAPHQLYHGSRCTSISCSASAYLRFCAPRPEPAHRCRPRFLGRPLLICFGENG